MKLDSRILALAFACLIALAAVACAPQKGGTEVDPNTAKLEFSSFDGGGPEYTAALDDPGIADLAGKRFYPDPDHETLDGAPYTVVFTLTGKRPGETGLTVRSHSPIDGEEEVFLYRVSVDESLRVTVRSRENENPDPSPEKPDAITPNPVLVIHTENRILYANFAKTSAAEDLIRRLSMETLVVDLHDYGGFEKIGALPWTLEREEEQIRTVCGDVLLYGGDQISFFCGENLWSYARLAKIENLTPEAYAEAFGEGNTTVTLSVEWSE